MSLKDNILQKERSLRKVAALIDMPYSTLNDIVNNKVALKKCSYENLSKIADYLEVKVDDLVLNNSPYNFINDDIKIDFALPKSLNTLIYKIEKADKINDYGTYNALTEPFVYTMCKNAYANGKITKKEWEIIQKRYLL